MTAVVLRYALYGHHWGAWARERRHPLSAALVRRQAAAELLQLEARDPILCHFPKQGWNPPRLHLTWSQPQKKPNPFSQILLESQRQLWRLEAHRWPIRQGHGRRDCM
jgi:hypothetical protein